MPLNRQKELQRIKSQWYQKLKDEGFEDIESSKGNLKRYNRNTINFQHREKVLEYYLKLDEYLVTADIKQLHRDILSLYTQGVYLKDIARRLDKGESTIRLIISQYKKLILALLSISE